MTLQDVNSLVLLYIWIDKDKRAERDFIDYIISIKKANHKYTKLAIASEIFAVVFCNQSMELRSSF